ncbi:Hypothetical protein, putative [Bodo saltans]|uniref:Uncharacterized protein n=1 Tax=Bodo saltans TaxID=75058 RepID=A0A0S4J7N1_BODSA|nr:Hypothetical protein, putative [Bodo saltans]|eukprot:CUG85927.1 Hypothetical protein, putative [Bodo saltans]
MFTKVSSYTIAAQQRKHSNNTRAVLKAERQMTGYGKVFESLYDDGGGTHEREGGQRRAWVTISPSQFPSANVVLHIPGVITLCLQCEDAPLEHEEIRSTLRAMVESEPFGLVAQRRSTLRNHVLRNHVEVVPILFLARAEHT